MPQFLYDLLKEHKFLISMENEVDLEIYNTMMKIPVKMRILIYFKFVVYHNMIQKLFK